jgi:hypothetical protein
MGLSCLNDQTAPFIVDASTVINLNGTNCAAAILRAIPNRIVVMDAVIAMNYERIVAVRVMMLSCWRVSWPMALYQKLRLRR